MKLRRVTIWVEEGIWERLKTLPDPSNKENASYHTREALELYLKVIETESPCRNVPTKHQKIFEDQDQELDREDTCN